MRRGDILLTRLRKEGINGFLRATFLSVNLEIKTEFLQSFQGGAAIDIGLKRLTEIDFDERQLFFPVNDNYNSRLYCLI